MPGIYIHIPFCRSACNYCDFHFSTLLKNKFSFTEALVKEISLRKDFFSPETKLSTLYFGGGTPSLLTKEELDSILNEIHKHFSFEPDFEFTLECNPEDITEEALSNWKKSGVNRLSIGIQSFRNEDLKWMNRGHSAEQAIQSVKLAQKVGLSNITIDLIYHLPNLTQGAWINNLHTFLSLDIPHLSAYSLTVEKQTLLAHEVETQKILMPGDEDFRDHFRILSEITAMKGYEQYEISNFSLPGFRSKHNSSYWHGEPYLGLGPSAHSYDGSNRSWNVANNHTYIQKVNEGQTATEAEETLETKDKLNEYFMTSLRLIEGLSLEKLKNDFNCDLLVENKENVQHWLMDGLVQISGDKFTLTTEGKMIANNIISDLFRE